MYTETELNRPDFWLGSKTATLRHVLARGLGAQEAHFWGGLMAVWVVCFSSGQLHKLFFYALSEGNVRQ